MRDLSILLSEELESFYWMGFVMADGWVTSNVWNGSRHESLGVQLSSVDGKHLERFADYIGAKVSYGSRDTNFKKDSQYCRIGVGDAINVPLIRARFNISNSKTTTAPDWRAYSFSDKQLMSMFIGYIDGDGSINKRLNKDRLHLSIQTKATWVDNVNFFLETVQRVCGVMIAAKPTINCRGHLHLSICKNSLIWKLKVFAVCNSLPILARKWDKVTEIHAAVKRNSTKNVTFRSPDGTLHACHSIRRFASEVGLNYNAVLRLASRRISQYNGWSIHEKV